MLEFLLPLMLVAQPDPAPPEWQQDAELTAVTFVDADRGWAVGDRGAIWHTDDGGRNWRLQRSSATCRLEAVQFLDGNNGWAAGGWTQPYTHETRGVVLRTRDGGRTWQDTPGLTLPGLKQLKMIDSRQGWALGDPSTLFPSGVFRTDDGGRSWSPVPKGETAGWITGDFRDGRGGAVAGLGGMVATVTSGEVKPSRTPEADPRFLRRLLLCGEAGGWLVGDGGLALTTADGGCHWTPPPGALPPVAGDVDLRALAVRGNRVWIAGAPGSCVLHSPDNGRTWLSFRTDQTAPLLGLWFADDYRGWAVGALGTILHTKDGGQTWRLARSGPTRAALLGIFSEPQRIPLELIASQAGAEGYLTAVEILGRRDLEPGASTSAFTEIRRTHAAVVAAGGSGADTSWRFPLAEPGLVQSGESILARWNEASGGHAAEQLEEHLVRRIRQWRPDVIVTEDVSPRGDNPLAHLTNQLTLAAVAKAADDTAWPQQISRTGLAAWRVKKVLAVLPADKPGVVNLTPAQWSQPLGCSIADQAARGRALLVSDVLSPPRTVGLSLLVNQLPQGSGRGDVLSGISLAFGSDARRLAVKPPAGDLKALAEVARKRNLIDQLLSRIGEDHTVGAGWLAQVGDLTQGLSNQQAGEIIWQLAFKYHATGKSSQAAEALEYLLERHAQHPLADAAARWLVQYYASSEVAWRERQESKFEVQVAAATAQAAEPAAGRANPAPAIARTGFSSTAGNGLNPTQRAGRALALARQIEQSRPLLNADPAVRFSLATAWRQSGQPRSADRLFQLMTSSGGQSS
ncbi:MAG TPA: YCF48-related protein, partial [Pirellulaceae bacterium]|nr:YCF48-related protein [Pirellulaceae bacterium]